MKTNDSPFHGGTVCGVPGARCKRGDWRQAYANYLVQYAKDYAASGVPLTYVGPENEANPLPAGAQQAAGSPVQDSMTMTAAQTANFMGDPRPDARAIRSSDARGVLREHQLGLGAAVRGSDRGQPGGEHGNGAVHQPRLLRRARLATEGLEQTGLGDAVAARSAPIRLTRPGTTAPWGPDSRGRRNIHTGLTKANLGAFLYLWGANTSTTTITGPNTGLVDVNGTTVAASGRLPAYAGFSRFIRPGAVRIGTTTSATGLEVSAFRNSDGSIAMVALNSAHSRQVAGFSLRGLDAAHVTPYLTDTSHQLSAQTPITVKNSAFTATLPARSLVSYDIRS